MRMLPIACSLLLAACGYQPPARVDTSSPAYVADRDACKRQSTTEVNQHDIKTGLAWFSAPVRRWSQISDATQSCMAGRGYGRVRWCTAEELRSGSRTGDVIVTSSGVQCSDPPTRPTDTSPPDAASPVKAAR